MNYGRAIKTIRASKGVSQEDLSSSIGLDRSYLSRIEKGRRKPTIDTLKQISASLSIPFYLLTLLASDEEDLKGMPQEETKKIGHHLLQVLLSAQKDLPSNAS